MPGKFYITTPIYYVNDRPHIGHVYTTTIADVVARYHRLAGDDVFFLTGTDEHAGKVVDAAAERGLTPQQWADQNAAAFRETFAKLGMTNNDFVRTTEDRHKTRVQQYVQALLNSGDVYVGDYEGWYDAGQEEYVTDSKAQESQFKSPINGKPLVRKKEKNYFFKLKAYRDQVRAAIEDGRFAVQPDARRNEILNRLADAQDVPISRTGAGGWGIPVPGDAEQTIYVWIDALFNYLTYVDTPAPDSRRGYWESGATHLIAKDILWFHAAIWPALLMALQKCPGFDWVVLPKQVYAHSFWIAEGQKMSKSLGNFIDLEKIDYYVATFGLDALRYFLASNGPLGTTDSDFAESKFVEVYNSELANTLGNCFSRISNMTNRFFEGKIPQGIRQTEDQLQKFREQQEGSDPAIVFDDPLDVAAWPNLFHRGIPDYCDRMNRFNLWGAASWIQACIKRLDTYIETTAPFKLAKDPAKLLPGAEVSVILYNCAEAIRIASILLWPVMPGKMEELWRRIGCSEYAAALANNGRGDLAAWTKWGQLKPGAPILQGDPLFPRWQPPKK